MKNRRILLCLLLTVGGALCAVGVACGQGAPEPVLNPTTYRSPSGRFELTVDPSERFGRGPARYRLTAADGAESWAGERPFTLYDAVVAEDGSVAGYGYSLGREGQQWDRLGDLRVIFLDPRGQTRREEKTPRHMGRFLHALPEPTAKGLILDAPRDRLLVLLSDEHWQVYRFSDGRLLGQTDAVALLPKATRNSGALYDAASRLVPGAGLMLVQWRRTADSGARFALIDPEPPGRLVWSLELPRQPLPTSKADDSPEPVFDAILPTDAPDGFALWLAATGERVDYSIQPVQGHPRWQVREIGRQSAPAPAPVSREPAPPAPILPEGKLSALGQFTLRDQPGSGPATPIRAVSGFDFDARGQLGFLRREPGHAAFVLVEPERGEVLREVGLDAQDRPEGAMRLTWVGPGERWLVTSSPPQKGKTLGWFLDAGTGALTAIEDFDCPPMASLAGAGDGRFVVLASQEEQLIGFGPDARRLWTVDGTYETLFSPQAVTVLDGGKEGKVAAVVESVGHHVGLFDLATGKLRRRFDLKKSWGREPGYLVDICPDEGGGFIVQDFGVSPPYVRMTAAGAMRSPLAPGGSDGRPWKGDRLQRDPATGRLWTSDGDALLRLSADGKTVDHTLGEPVESERLSSIGALTVDDAGQVYAADRRSGAVHVFDATGAPLRVLRPAPGDLPEKSSSLDVAVAPDGRVFLGPEENWVGSGGSLGRVEFAPDGRRLGARTAADFTSQNWHFRPGGKGDDLLVLGFEQALLTNLAARADKPPRLLPRQPDGRWLESPQQAAFAPDGMFAVTSRRRDSYSGGTWTVNLFAPDGEGKRTIYLPAEFDGYRLAFNGRHFAVCQAGRRLAVFDAETGAGVLSFIPELPERPSLERGQWSMFSVRGGRELWLAESETRTVARFAWPP